MKIRQAGSEDVQGIAKVHVDSWRTTYQGVFPDSFLAELSYEQREELWEHNVQVQQVYVAENESGDIVGFSVGGKERTGDYEKYIGELYAIYILENYQRQGIGRALLEPVVDNLRDNQLNSMLVWVLEGNDAISFYEAMGGKKVDSEEVEVAGKAYNELAYGWETLEGMFRPWGVRGS